MRETPRQPRNLDPVDTSSLAYLGHRIESWQALKDTSVPLQERAKKARDVILAEVSALKESGFADGEAERELLSEDFAELLAVTDDEAAFAQLCDERIELYKELRGEFIRSLEK